MGEVLDHLGLDPADIPAATLDAVRQSLEGDPDPRGLAAEVRPGGIGRGYASTIRSGSKPTTDAELAELEQLTPRQLADRLVPREF